MLRNWYRCHLAAKLSGIIAEIKEIEKHLTATGKMDYVQQYRLQYLARKRGELESKLEKKTIKENYGKAKAD